MIRVAFTLIGGQNWTGGYNYLLNLIQALVIHKREAITPIIFIPADETIDIEVFTSLPGVEVISTNLLNPNFRKSNLIKALLWGKIPRLVELFEKHHIDIIFEAAQFFGWRLDSPVIAWIPDFQHKALPHLFSRLSWWKREFGFRAQIVSNRLIMLSSDDARRDCERYYPQTRRKAFTVHFSVPAGTVNDFDSARAIADSYGLPENFIFLPNQFWKHKNHLLVINALMILRARGSNVVVAASGKQYDPRNPDYFSELEHILRDHALEDSFRLLGLIPYAHVNMLMRCCQAMLNPSLFEGWSTTVEEAKAIATPMLLSDLEVHREQMGSNAQYFSRDSAMDLANLLEIVPPYDRMQRDRELVHAQNSSDARVGYFAEDFTRLVMDAIRGQSK